MSKRFRKLSAADPRRYAPSGFIRVKPESGRYNMEVDRDVERYIEDKRKEFYEEWIEYMERDELDEDD